MTTCSTAQIDSSPISSAAVARADAPSGVANGPVLANMIPNFTVPLLGAARRRGRSALGLLGRPVVLEQHAGLVQLVDLGGARAQPVLEGVVVVLAPVGGGTPDTGPGSGELVGRLGHLA